MPPAIRYTRTSDDVSIAYWVHGDGPVLVQTPLVPYSHIEMEWRNAHLQRWYERVGKFATIVRYDSRLTGLSARNVHDVSLDAHVRDLAAVVDAVATDHVAIMGVFHSGPPAVSYAAANPERVSQLMLWCTYALGADYWRAAQSLGLRALRQTDYRLFLRTAAHELLGWHDDQEADSYADLMAAAVSAEDADRLIASTRAFDVTDEVARVTCPVMVMHRRDLQWIDASLSRDLATRSSNARLTVLEGRSPLPGTGDIEGLARAVADFLEVAPAAPSNARIGGFRAVVFTDLVDHTRMMAALGDELGREVLREHERITRQVLADHGGTEVKAMGDGFLASFLGVTDAVRCAVALQRAIEARNAAAQPASPPLAIRIGINAGEPIEEDGDLFGAAVILASRIAATAGAGEILVSSAVRELSAGKNVRFLARGAFRPKGYEEPMSVWAVDWAAS
jgi:class 3 adenylate cyclase